MNNKKKYRVYAFKDVKAYDVTKAEAQISARKVMTSQIEIGEGGEIIAAGGSPNLQELFQMLYICPVRNHELKAIVETILERRPDPKLIPAGSFIELFL